MYRIKFDMLVVKPGNVKKMIYALLQKTADKGVTPAAYGLELEDGSAATIYIEEAIKQRTR